MATYATVADCQAFTEGLTVEDEDQMERLIERAERAIDRVLAVDLRDPDGDGLKVPDPAELSARQQEGLRRATCAQVEAAVAHLEVAAADPPGPVGARRVRGPDFEIEFPTGTGAGVVPLAADLPVTEAALRELRLVGLADHWKTVRPPPAA